MERFTNGQAIGLKEYIKKILGLYADNMSLRYINYLHVKFLLMIDREFRLLSSLLIQEFRIFYLDQYLDYSSFKSIIDVYLYNWQIFSNDIATPTLNSSEARLGQRSSPVGLIDWLIDRFVHDLTGPKAPAVG